MCELSHTRPYQRLFAWFMARTTRAVDRAATDERRDLLAPLRGDVLEIGPGAGANLRYFAPEVRWIGVEPNAYMFPYLQDEAKRLDRAIDVRHGTVEQLDLPAASVDAVVSTLVLCSVRDPSRALAEIVRVLRPGGSFVFLEHVAAPAGTRRRRWQNAVQPVWSLVGDGCHPNRETWRVIEEAGFAEVDIRHFDIGVPLVGPHIMGTAIKG